MKKQLLAVLCFFGLPFIAQAQIPIVYYDFENNVTRSTFENLVEMSINTPPVGSVFTYTTSGPGGCSTIGCSNAAGLLGAGIDVHSGAADGSSLSAGAWSQVAGDPTTSAASYYQFCVNTLGFSGISLTFDVKFGNNNSPDRVGVLISPNGITWTFVGSTTTPNGNTIPVKAGNQAWGSSGNFNLSANSTLSTIANNNGTLYIRVYGYNASGAGGGGTWMSLDNVTVFATGTTAGKVFTTMDEIAYARGRLSTAATPATAARGSFTATGAGTNVTINSTSGLRIAAGQTFALTSAATATFGASGILQGGGIFNIASGCTIATTNAGGVPGSVTTTGANVYAAGANYTFNAATATPFPASMGNPANVTINPGAGNTVTLNLSPTISGVLSFTAGRLAIGANMLTLNGTVSGMSAANSITGSTSSNLTIGGTGALGTLFFNQTTPGTTNALNTFVLNRTASGSATLGNALSIGSGGLALTAGALADGGNVITLAGNISGTGTHTSSSFGKIMMTGSGATISAATLGNLELNNAGGFSLSGSPVVEGVLTLTSGKLTIGATDFTLGTAASIGGTPSAANMIVATGVGRVRKLFSALGTFTYPIGDNSNYSPIALEMLNGTFAPGANAAVNVKNVKHPNNANVTSYINRYWQVAVSGVSDLIYGVPSAKYVPGDVVGTEADIAMGQYTGVFPWVRYGVTNTSTHSLSLLALLEATSDFTGISSVNPTVTASPATTASCPSNPATLSATATSGDPVLTYKWLPAAGLSATTGASVTANPSANTVYTVTITDGNGFTATSTAAVNVENIQPITGNAVICMPVTTTLNTTTAGGTWQTSDAAIATVGAATGIVTGQSVGTALISYVMPSGCYVTRIVTVEPTTAGLTGTLGVCDGATTQLLHPINTGTWATSEPTVATVNTTGLVTAQDPGTAIITYTLPSGCKTNAFITVNATPPAITGLQTVCVGSTTDFAVGDVGGTWESANAAIASVSATGNVHGEAQGNTTISYTNTSGCTVTRSVTVNETPAAMTGDLDICNGLTSQLNTTATGGSWSASGGGTVASVNATGLVSAVDAGTSTISYVISSTGCYTTSVFTVYALPPAITGDAAICHLGTSDLDIADAGGTWQSANTSIASVDGNGVITGGIDGTTNITYTNTNGCIATKEVTVYPVPADITGDLQICAGESTTLTGAGGGTWSCACTLPGVALSSSGIFTGGSAGTTNVTYTMPNGCFTYTTVTVNALPSAMTGTFTVCASSTTQLSNTGGGTWQTGSSLVSVDATGLVSAGTSAGTATITYTLPNTCAIMADVTVNELPTAISGFAEACVNATAALTATPADGAWSTADAGIASIPNSSVGNISGVAAGVTSITYTLPSGCNTYTAFTVNALPTVITGPASLCLGASGTVASTPTGGTWASANEAVLTIDVLGSMNAVAVGASVVTYTAPTTGCKTTRTISVNPNPAPITGIAGFCVGTTTDLDNADAPGTWSSTNGSGSVTVDVNTGIVSGDIVGTATVTYTLSTGCDITKQVTVYALPANILGTFMVCEQATINLSAPETGTWQSTNTTVASVDASGVIAGNQQGTSTIYFTNLNGCKRSIEVTVNETPTAISGDLRICNEQTTQLASTPIGGTWSTPATSIAVSNSGLVTASASGTAVVSYVLSTGCYSNATVTVDALPDAIAGIAPVCEQETITLTNATTGGTWSTSDNAIASITTASGALTGEAQGNAIITYTSAEGCIATVQATVNALPTAISGTQQVCTGAQTDLDNTSTGGTWSSGTLAVGTIDASTGMVAGIAAGTTEITYTLNTGCKVHATVTVNQTPTITVAANICEGSSTTFVATPTGGIWVTDGVIIDVNASSGLASGLSAGSADVTYTLATGCATATVVTVNALPAAITGTFTACVGASSAMVDPGTAGTWSSSNIAVADIDATGVVSANGVGNATITYTLPTGCKATHGYTVNPLPAAFFGATRICQGVTGGLSNALVGGTWLSADNSIADVVAATGVITGVAAGTVDVTYTLATGCARTETITVNAAVPTIAGGGQVCQGLTLSLSNTEVGGTWTSSNATVASVNASDGTVTAATVGNAIITYSLPTSCFAITEVSVSPLPAAITGSMQVCAGLTTTLSNATSSGSWSGGAAGIASIDAAGMVTGIAAGTAQITYGIPATGCQRRATVTVNALPVEQTVTGGGNYCAGGSGVTIGLSNSIVGTTYTLRQGTLNVLAMVGAGTPLNYGTYPSAGVYTVRATIAATGCTKDMAGSATVSINPLVTPIVTMLSNNGDTVCAGTPTTFTTTSVNGGTTPLYEWMVNSTIVSGASSYTYTPVNGDVVKVRMTSTAQCPFPTSVNATKTMVVFANQMPTVAITKTSHDTTCQFQPVAFHASGTWGGSSPVYTWLRNGTSIGTGTDISFTPADGDVVTCKLTSNYRCRLADNVTSAGITVNVDSVYVPTVTISADPGLAVVPGKTVTLTATVTDAGPAPYYEWSLNGIDLAGEHSATLKRKFNNGDEVKCTVYGSGACGLPSFNTIFMTVDPSASVADFKAVIKNVKLAPNPNNGHFTISASLSSIVNEPVSIDISNMLGQSIHTSKVEVRNGVLETTIDLDDSLSNGMYMLSINAGGTRTVLPFVIKQ